eukprot:Rhum_TRINITY_DN14277_c24_g1::Rhum_TRINITY_DN14277_c24_g1_i1::g.77913::m.77913
MSGGWKSVSASAVRKSAEAHVGTEDDFYRMYSVGNKIGEGAFATVHVCTSNTTEDEFAVKLVDKSKAGMGQLKDIYNEVKVMKGLNHPNIISLLGSFEGKEHIIIVMNRVAGGTLFDRIIKCKNYTEKMAAGAVNNLMQALSYLHAANIAHRDIKPENLLLRNPYIDGSEGEMTDVVLADFGLAATAPMKATCGSPCYVAPEVVLAGFGERYHRPCEPYDPRCDVWSLGVVLYVMLCGRFPFSAPGNSRNALFNLIVTAELRFAHPTWDDVSGDAKDFIRRLLIKDPSQRPSSSEALRHPWITGVDLSSPLQRNASLAQSVAELKAFTLRKHVQAAMSVYRVAGALFSTSSAKVDNIPAFLKYVKNNPESPFEQSIPVQSQSKGATIHTVHLGKIGRSDRKVAATNNKAHFLNTLCSCPSVSVCRHIQYVYQWLFMGEGDEIPPHITGCEERRSELLERLDQLALQRNNNCSVATFGCASWAAGAATAVGMSAVATGYVRHPGGAPCMVGRLAATAAAAAAGYMYRAEAQAQQEV